MIEIYSDTKVYIACPAFTYTGGPELLHQLAYNLNYNLNIDSYMYYYPINHKNPINPNYLIYKPKFIKEIIDSKKNILIVPEIISGIKLLKNYQNIRKIIWWLSVDKFFLSFIKESKINFLVPKIINKISKIIRGRNLFDIDELIINSKKYNKYIKSNKYIELLNLADYHFTQSTYSMNFLLNKGIPENKIYYLSDYLNDSFFKIDIDLNKKEDLVAFNPKKGLLFTKKIIKRSKDIKFIPLENMTREQLINTLNKAKVYIDFGSHPGKDRIPREAAILGCCVITGKRGSAAFFDDVSIPDKYKFEDKEENIPKIIEMIKSCFQNFYDRYRDFENYRQIIKQEPINFIQDIKKIFFKVNNK